MLDGSILEGVPGSNRLYNTSTLFGPDGGLASVYPNVHRFDVKAPDREYLESRTSIPNLGANSSA